MTDHVVDKMSADVTAMAEKLKKSVTAIEKAMPKIHASPKKQPVQQSPTSTQEQEKKAAPVKANAKASSAAAKATTPGLVTNSILFC